MPHRHAADPQVNNKVGVAQFHVGKELGRPFSKEDREVTHGQGKRGSTRLPTRNHRSTQEGGGGRQNR